KRHANDAEAHLHPSKTLKTDKTTLYVCSAMGISAPKPSGMEGTSGSILNRVRQSGPKRQKLLNTFSSLRPHPYGIQPLGNRLFDSNEIRDVRPEGLGFFAPLEDEMILSLFLMNDSLIDARDLCRLSMCSKAMYVLTCVDEIWRQRTIAGFGGKFGDTFGLSWRDQFRQRACEIGWNGVRIRDRESLHPLVPIRVKGFYSDYLFSSWRCGSIPLDKLCRTDAPDTIDRRSNLTVEDFIKEYSEPNKPVILTDVISSWPAFKTWTLDYLVRVCGDVDFRAEAVDLPLKAYASYSARCSQSGGSFEESPLYLFDRHFATRTVLSNDYTIPSYFSEDLFSVFGKERPDYRWLILGPPRSGSTFHIDPNQTNAWNAVIRGSKKWIMFPPEIPPPGVYPNEDGSEVTSPVSLAEWFLNHYDEMKSSPVKPIECICRAGELIYVPRGWWHAVMNLEETIAITQNFVSSQNLPQVLRFLATKPDQISGFRCSGEGGDDADACGAGVYERFVEALGASYMNIVEKEREERETLRKPAAKEEGSGVRLSSVFNSSSEESGGFRFSFS
ncbi:hypothetical protein HDU97_007006, partial [Phlyctochytrium planicorne]